MRVSRLPADPRARGLRIRVVIVFGAALLAGVPLAILPACLSPDSPLGPELLEQARAAPCGELTYQNFAADFFARYCLACHNDQLVGDAQRTDAPTGINYNRLDQIRLFAQRIRLRAGVQGDMPPRLLAVPQPTDEERLMLIQWIDCGTPSAQDLAEALP